MTVNIIILKIVPGNTRAVARRVGGGVNGFTLSPPPEHADLSVVNKKS